ncbi:MAG: hypothetical protein DDT19_00679 [Syntrophomonadaceae bacterium]|nr:hypothetical protein [Bacillota bacterium]
MAPLLVPDALQVPAPLSPVPIEIVDALVVGLHPQVQALHFPFLRPPPMPFPPQAADPLDAVVVSPPAEGAKAILGELDFDRLVIKFTHKRRPQANICLRENYNIAKGVESCQVDGSWSCDSDSEERYGHEGMSEPIIGLRKAAL